MKKILTLSAIMMLATSTAAFAEGTEGKHEGKMCEGKKCGMHEGKRHGGWFKKFDANNDGNISRAEADAAHDAKFKKFDANNDGQITKEEKEASREKMKKEHEARREEFRKKFDTNKDGEISKEEKEAAKKQRKENREAAEKEPSAGK